MSSFGATFGIDNLLFLLRTAIITAELSFGAMLLGGLLGLAVALGRTSSQQILRRGAAAYIGTVQGIPVLVVLFVVYFGLPYAGINVPPLVAAILSLSVFASGYLGDIWRGAIESVARQQWEASASLAMTRAQQYRYIILPQAIRISLPPTVGFVVQLVKNTSIVSIVGVMELVRGGQVTSTATFQPLLVFGVVAAIYFCICFPLSLLSRKMESIYG
ncbi:MAG: amino acid ABC transporter permease [Acetobacteraceae bacterium]